jgi:hypothetical protein
MGRKKKKVEQVSLVMPIPPGGDRPSVPSLPAARLKAEAESMAKECGLTGELYVQEPERVEYPKYGHGYVVVVREKNGLERSGTVRLTSEGKKSYWSMDGNVVL